MNFTRTICPFNGPDLSNVIPKKQMKTNGLTRAVLAATAALAMSGAAQAALVDRGGGMIYDTELNITWLKDWNQAFNSGYATANAGGTGSNQIQADGRMGWDAASNWANNLVYGGFDDWRLPTMIDTDSAGCDLSKVGGTDCGYNVQTKTGSVVFSELAHLYYKTLGNKAFCSPLTSTVETCGLQSGYGMLNAGPFSDVHSAIYWTGLEYSPVPSLAWDFDTATGFQYGGVKATALYAVAVRTGDVAAAVPEPQTWALVTLALGTMLLARRRALRS